MCILFFHAHPPLFFSYSFAVSVFHALHAVYDVDAGRQVVPLLGQLYAVKVVDALLAGGHVGCNGADAVVVRLNHHLGLKHLAIQNYRLLVGVELRTDGLCDGAVVEDEVADECDRSAAAAFCRLSRNLVGISK